MTDSKTIKVYIKFQKGLGNAEDRIYGFVTKVNGSWKGCYETEKKKKIVFVAQHIAQDIVPNVLYSCSLIPMREKHGFIAQSASVVKFRAVISTVCRKGTFMVNVKFGNKIFIYDPSSKEHRRNNIQAIAEKLKWRIDLENALCVAEEFVNAAFVVKRLYDQYGKNV